MYDQLQDGDITYWAIYIFALEYVVTALTTVGFGSHTYASNAELVFVCLIEVASALYTAYLIAIMTNLSTLLQGFTFRT